MTTNQTYVKTEVVGSSNKSVSDAIESAIATASRSLRNLDWFEVVDVRGNIRDNRSLSSWACDTSRRPSYRRPLAGH